MDNCELCGKSDQYAWRIGDLETKVTRLDRLLIGTLICSISTLVGVIIVLVTK